MEAYEEEHHAIKTGNLSPIDALKFLMEENNLNAADIGKLLGERTLGSKLLRGQRKIGLKYAKTRPKNLPSISAFFSIDFSRKFPCPRRLILYIPYILCILLVLC